MFFKNTFSLKILIISLAFGGVLSFGFLVVAQEPKIPHDASIERVFVAPERFNKVDRNNNKIYDDLEERIGTALVGDRFDTIVLLNSSLGGSLNTLPVLKERHGNFDETLVYSSIGGFAANLTKGQIIAFSQDSDVKQIEFDALAYPHLATAQEWFGTAKARIDFGVSGNADGLATYSKDDIVIAILDTGIDPGHVDLDGGKIIGWYDATINGGLSPYDELGDCVGHGSHVSSIAAGEGDGDAALKGVAPGAALVGVKVLSLRKIRGKTICTAATSEIVSGIQWIIDNKTFYGINVANMSLGLAGCSDGTDALSVAVNAAVDAGIVMTVSAGNEGSGTCTVGSPAAAENAITVGAMADVYPGAKSGSLPGRGFYQAHFSSRGFTDDGRIKPDISSPGVLISAVAAGTGNGYKIFSGTSMASPFTAGLVALILDANPTLSTAQVKSHIESTAIDWGVAGKDIDYGSGRVQGYEAIKLAGGFPGENVATPAHIQFTGTVAAGGFSEHDIDITDITLPLSATMIIGSGEGTSPDLELEIRDGAGNPLFSCSGGGPFSSASPCACITDSDGICKSRTANRQETVGFQPSSTGILKLRVVSFSGGGDYLIDVSLGQSAVAITLATDGTTPFGIVTSGATVDTTSSGTNDVQVVDITIGPADLAVRSTNFTDGSNIWTLGASSGADTVKWEFSEDGTTWTTFTSANTLFTLDANVPEGGSRNLYLRLTTPTSSSSANEHSATVTFVATAP